MSDRQTTTIQPALTPRLLQLIEPLQHTQAGAVLYQHVTALAEQTDSDQMALQRTCSQALSELLTVVADALPGDAELQAHIRIIQSQLQRPLTLSDLQTMRRIIGAISGGIQPTERQATAPSPSAASGPDETSQPFSLREIHPQQSPAGQTEHAQADASARRGNITHHDSAEQRVDSTYRRHLDDKRERILKIQKTLSRHVSEVIKQNEEFGVLLEVEYDALRQTDNIKELQLLKQSLLHEVEKLLKGNHNIASKLDKAKNYLKIIESEGHHLNEELTRVHILSLTDELTELPNRRAFMRRLEDEVARVQRYGSPLSMALIDMDTFKAINDKYGHSAGDEVLRTFSNRVLSIFRHHDMVARYGGEEFAILLPNTDIEGTRRALEKVREQAAQTQFRFNGATLPLPTFSAGVALYKPGETPGILIERADKALYRAKDKGRNRIEIDHAETGSKSSGTV